MELNYFTKLIFQNIITKKELVDKSYSLMKEVRSSDDEEPASKKKKPDYTNDYKKLISLMVGCQYVSFQPQTSEISFQSKSDKNVETLTRLVGGATLNDPAEFPGGPVPLTELQNKPLGDIRRKGAKQKFQYERGNNHNWPAK